MIKRYLLCLGSVLKLLSMVFFNFIIQLQIFFQENMDKFIKIYDKLL